MRTYQSKASSCRQRRRPVAGNDGGAESRLFWEVVDPFRLAAEKIVALSKREPRSRRLYWYFSAQALAPDRQKARRSGYRIPFSEVEFFVLLRALVALKYHEASSQNALHQAVRVEISDFYDGPIERVLHALKDAGLVTADLRIDLLILRAIEDAEKKGLLNPDQDRHDVVSEIYQEQTRLAKQYSELTGRKIPRGRKLVGEKARVAKELSELDNLMIYHQLWSGATYAAVYIEPDPISTGDDALNFNPLNPRSRVPKWLNKLLVGLGRRKANEPPFLADDYAIGMHSASINLDAVLNLLGPPPDSAGTHTDPAPRVPAGVS